MRRTACLLLLALLAPGCATVPDDGAVTRVRPVVAPAQNDRFGDPRVRRVFEAARPAPGATPEQVVEGFLDAHADPTEDHGIARLYLVDPSGWQADGVTVLSGERNVEVEQVRGETATVRLTAALNGSVSVRGDYRSLEGAYSQRLSLRRVRGEWRLTEVPRGLVLSEARFRSRFARTPLYFADARRERLVPEPIFVPQGQDQAALVLDALLTGPSAWLRPAVHNAIPARTRLVSELVVVNGVAEVNLSREADVAVSQRPAMVAQIAWTLTEGGLGITGVRLRIEGRPLVLPGVDQAGTLAHAQSHWRQFSPEPVPEDDRLFFLRNGSLYAIGDDPQPVLLRASVAGVGRFAVSPRGGRLAGVVPVPGDRQVLVLGPLAEGDLQETAVRGQSLTDPAWTPDGSAVWTVRTTATGTQDVVTVTVATGAVTVVRADVARAALPVAELRLSPEGSRVALVGGPPGARQLLVGRVEGSGATATVAGLQVVQPRLHDVQTVGWDDATRLLVVARLAGARPSLLRVEVDGYELTDDTVDGLPAAPSVVATAPGRVTYVEAAGRVYRRANQGVWAEEEEGTGPTYAG